MKSLTAREARQYCSEASTGLEFDRDRGLYYIDSELPGIIVHAPSDAREMLSFGSTLMRITGGSQFNGALLWLLRYEIGPVGKAVLGWKTIESIRRAEGDLAGLSSAPAQHFREDENDQLEVFLLQVLLFGWAGYLLPTSSQCFVNFRSSQRWVFYARERQYLETLFLELREWSPAYEDFEGQSEVSERIYNEAEELMASGNVLEAIARYRTSLAADDGNLEAARGLYRALRSAGLELEADQVKQVLDGIEEGGTNRGAPGT